MFIPLNTEARKAISIIARRFGVTEPVAAALILNAAARAVAERGGRGMSEQAQEASDA